MPGGEMRIGAYQFSVSGDTANNFIHIKTGIEAAGKAGVRLLLVPECAVTGYPPCSIRSASEADFDAVDHIHEELQAFAEEYEMYLVVGTIIKEEERHYNAAIVFSPEGGRTLYRKRALWGWDRENFSAGQDSGLFTADTLKIGIRICFEVRFPEYFRELFKEQTDLDLVLFYDESDKDDLERYQLIQGHIQTRAAENVCYFLSCNTTGPYQTAPTGLCDRSGRVLAELERGKEGLLIYDFEKTPLSFSEAGRRDISDSLMSAAFGNGNVHSGKV